MNGYGIPSDAEDDAMRGEAIDFLDREYHRVTAFATYRLLASGQHPDLLSPAVVDRIPVEPPPEGAVLRYTKTLCVSPPRHVKGPG